MSTLLHCVEWKVRVDRVCFVVLEIDGQTISAFSLRPDQYELLKRSLKCPYNSTVQMTISETESSQETKQTKKGE